MAEGKKSFLLRLDPRVWEEIQAWAAQELRSVNGQIEYLLREALARRKGGSQNSAGGKQR
ncbi:MAG: Arc family DNA binding domain-containing protein [Candidatus Latescibacterota bacterium]